jgi:predicted enzyme related to lactoylglutathione lyase
MFDALDHVLMFVPAVRPAAEWYGRVLGIAPRFVDENFASIRIGTAELCFHVADAKVPAGRAGQVGYWRVQSVSAARSRFEAAGATLYRGPLGIENGQAICQLADPFGNLVGVIGIADA